MAESDNGDIPVRPLGKTGLQVSIIGFGGGHCVNPRIRKHVTIRLIQEAVDAGVTFMDNAWEYADGESERRMGIALQGRRDDVVLMTKVCARDARTAEQQLGKSLRRLRTDVIDIWQFHEVNYDNDPEWIFRAGGAVEAAVAAREAGKVRFIGFTGHKSPHILQRMLAQDFPWDTCQMPINVLDAHYRSFQNDMLPELVRRGIGVIGMKSLGGGGQIVRSVGLSAEQCRGYALSLPISTLVCGIQSNADLRQDIAFARGFEPLAHDEMRTLEDRVYEEASDGRHEWFKSMQTFDSQYHRDQHGFRPVA